MTGTIPLRDVGGCTPIPEWRAIYWESCGECGDDLYAPRGFSDGEPVVCGECGCLHHMQAGENRWAVVPDFDMATSTFQYLRPMALAGFRRLLRL